MAENETPPLADAHRAIGAYFSAFSRVEHELGESIKAVYGLQHQCADGGSRRECCLTGTPRPTCKGSRCRQEPPRLQRVRGFSGGRDGISKTGKPYKTQVARTGSRSWAKILSPLSRRQEGPFPCRASGSYLCPRSQQRSVPTATNT